MIIAQRTLLLDDNGVQRRVIVSIHAPEQFSDTEWRCHFEIDWPQAKAQRWGTGVDAVQALLLAMQMIGIEIYASAYHGTGTLRWEFSDSGYGFPVAHNVRNLLTGDDARYL